MLMELGEWLRQQRQARGWSRREMARRIIQAGRECGDTTLPAIDSMYRNVHRWEEGVTLPLERFQLYYCRAFGISLDQFGTAPPPAPDSGNGAAPPAAAPAAPVAGLEEVRLLAARFQIEREVTAAAHDGTDHAGQYDQHWAGDATLEQFRADLGRLARLSGTGDAFAVFTDLRRVRDRAGRVADRRLRLREQAGLLVALGALNGLMGALAVRLGAGPCRCRTGSARRPPGPAAASAGRGPCRTRPRSRRWRTGATPGRQRPGQVR